MSPLKADALKNQNQIQKKTRPRTAIHAGATDTRCASVVHYPSLISLMVSVGVKHHVYFRVVLHALSSVLLYVHRDRTDY